MFRSLLSALVFTFLTFRAEATLWSVYAGADGGFGSADATGTAARFNFPGGVAVDAQGNAYVADGGNRTIRKVTPAGVVTTLAGVAGVGGTVDGTGPAARLSGPFAIALLPAATAGAFGVPVGSCVFGDRDRIRVVTPAGVVTTLAGGASGGVDGTGAQAGFLNSISGVAVDDATSTVYISEFGSRVRKMTPGGVVTTLAGSATQSGYVDDVGAAARFGNPVLGLVVLPGGDLLVSDVGNRRFRRVTPQGVVSTYATTPVNAPSTTYGMVVDASGNVYCVFFNGVAKIDAAAGHAITTVAGSGGGVYVDGQGAAANFYNPAGIAFNSDGDLLVADSYNHAIRKVTLAGAVTTLAGKGINQGSADGTGTAAAFADPKGVGVDGTGQVYVADSGNGTVRQIASGGVVTTLAGMAGSFGNVDGVGASARFQRLAGLAAQADATLYVADNFTGQVRMITPPAAVSTLMPMLNSPGAVAVAPAGGALALVDQGNHLILAISPGGVLSTVAGMSGVSGADDGTGTGATFNSPSGVAVDAAGTIYVADTGNGKIRKITMPGGVVTTLAGGSGGLTDGVGAAAGFNSPRGVAVDAAGNVYVAEDSAIRKVTPTGRVITVGGTGTEGNGVGEGRAATFKRPSNIAVAPDGTLYVSDVNQRIVRGVDRSTEPPFLTAPLANSVTSSPVTVTYELTEAAASGSVTVTFTPASGSPVTLALTLDYAAQGVHTFTFDPDEPVNTSGGAISGGQKIPDGLYAVTLSYQDARGNAAAAVTKTGVRVDKTAPIFNVPQNGLPVQRTLAGTLPDYTALIPIIDSTAVTVTQSPLPSVVTTYPSPPITVTLKATDAAGNVSTYDLTVDVRPENPINVPVLIASTKKTVAGDTAPGVGTHGLPMDAVLTSFGPPAIDEDGNMAFLAKWTSVTGPLKKGAGIFTETKCIATLGGDPPVSGANYKSFLDPVISHGKVAFLATLSGVPAGQSSVILSEAPTGSLAVLAQTGTDALVGGATFKKFTGVQAFGNLVGFLAQVTGGTGANKISAANDVGLWVNAGSNYDLVCALREGDPIDPNVNDSKKIKTLVSFAVGAGSPGQGRGWLSEPYGVVMPALVILDDQSEDAGGDRRYERAIR